MQLNGSDRAAEVGLLLTIGAVALAATGLAVAATPVSAADGGGNVSLYTSDAAGFEDAAGVERAIADGGLEDAEELVVGATLVVAVDSDRLASDLRARNGSTTERFVAALEDGAVLHLIQTNPTTMRPAKAIHLGPENTTVHRRGNATYLVVDTGSVDPSWDPRQDDSVSDPELRGGERFAVRYGHENGSTATSDAVVELRTVAAELRGSYDPLAPERVNRTVAVRVDPERSVAVRLTLANGATRTIEPEVVPWSGFRGVTLDLRDVEPGTSVTVALVHDGTVVDRRNGTVREPVATLGDPTVSADDGDVFAARLNVTADLSHGGQVVVTDGDGDRLGVGRVPPGADSVSVGLGADGDAPDEFRATELEVRAVRDEPTGDVPYPGPGASTSIAVDDPGWLPNTPPSSPTATATATDSVPDESTPSTDGDGPGFGAASLVVAVTLLGLLLRGRPIDRGRR